MTSRPQHHAGPHHAANELGHSSALRHVASEVRQLAVIGGMRAAARERDHMVQRLGERVRVRKRQVNVDTADPTSDSVARDDIRQREGLDRGTELERPPRLPISTPPLIPRGSQLSLAPQFTLVVHAAHAARPYQPFAAALPAYLRRAVHLLRALDFATMRLAPLWVPPRARLTLKRDPASRPLARKHPNIPSMDNTLNLADLTQPSPAVLSQRGIGGPPPPLHCGLSNLCSGVPASGLVLCGLCVVTGFA